jgi:hypothetical protein
MCTGEACALCGAGLRTRLDEPRCEHDVVQRRPDTLAAAIADDALHEREIVFAETDSKE